MAIEKGGHTLMMRLLAIDLEHTFNHSKHTMYILCCREQSNKEQYHVGNNIQYCTQKWMSEISEGNKFSMAIGSGTYTTGFYDSARAGIWKEDELTDPVVNLSVPDFEELIMNTGLKLY
jgi:hypothetical protein